MVNGKMSRVKVLFGPLDIKVKKGPFTVPVTRFKPPTLSPPYEEPSGAYPALQAFEMVCCGIRMNRWMQMHQKKDPRCTEIRINQ